MWLLMLLGQALTEILSEKENHGSGNGYCFKNHELLYQTGLGAFKQQTGQCLTIALTENRKKKKKEKSRRKLSYSKEHYKEILITDDKIFTVEETFIKQNYRVYARSPKKTHELVQRIK